MQKYIDLVDRLNYICENEESLEMPGGYKEFNLNIGGFFNNFKVGGINLFEISFSCSIEEIIRESINVLEEEIDELQYAREVLEFELKNMTGE